MYKLMLVVIIYCHTLLLIEGTIVSTTTGKVRGKLVYDDIFNLYYKSYEGIPYAEAPVDDLRFRPPVPKKPWKGVFEATAPGSVCPQVELIKTESQKSEDCLFLNVFTPVNITNLLPVLVYIHGGNFRSGSSNAEVLYGPQLIVKNNNVVVSFNFRQGALGFLSLDVEEASGNAGVKDALLAIKWVKSNIERFGGNSKQITIMGQSSGSAVAHVLLLTEKSNGLFQGAILLEGSATSPKFLQRKSREIALELCTELGIDTADSISNILNKLKKVDALEIVKAQEIIYERTPQKGFFVYTPFAISIEIEVSTAILTREPLDIVKDGIKQNVPIIVGFNNQEGLEIFNEPTLKNDTTGTLMHMNSNFNNAIPSDIKYPPGPLRDDLARSIREYYFDGGDISILTVQNYINFVTDSSCSYSIDSWIKEHTSRCNSAPVYYYVFYFDGSLNFFKLFSNITYPGAAHVDDIGYTFVTKQTRSLFINLDIRSQAVVNNRINLISNFMRYRNPTPDPRGFKWGAAGPKRNHIVNYGDPIFIQGPPIPERINFWYTAYAQYNKYAETTECVK